MLLLLPLLILITTVSFRTDSLRVNAATGPVGLVCLADPSTVTTSKPCPLSALTFSGPAPSPSVQKLPTQIIIGVYVSNSDAFNGFDIQLKANSSILKPAGVGLSGSLLSSPASSIICIGGVGQQCGPTDGPDVIDVESVMLYGFTSSPASGLLFTATYNITGKTPAGGITIGYQTGCSRSSITGSSPPVCVTLAAGANTPLPETVQTGTKFDNSIQPSWVALTSNVPSLTFLKTVPSPAAIITATAENGWPGFSFDSVTFSTAPTNNLNPGFFSSITCFTGGTSCSVNVTISATAGGIYSLTVLGTYVYTDPSTFVNDTLVARVTIQLNVQDVTINLNPSYRVYMFGTLAVAATVQALGGYAGTVTLSTQAVSPTTGITFQYPASFPLGANGVVTRTVNVTSTVFGGYGYRMKMSIIGSACLPFCSTPSITTYSTTMSFLVSGFKLTPNATSTSFRAGGLTTLSVTAQSLGLTVYNQFAGTISLGYNSSPAGINATESPPLISLTAGGSATFTTTFTSTRAGNYTVHITGMGGSNIVNQTTVITVAVLPNLSFHLTMSFQGVNATITGSLGVNSATRTLAGSTFLTVVNGTTGAAIYSKTDSVNIVYSMLGKAHFVKEIPTNPLWLATNCEIDVNAGSVNCFLSRTPDINHDGSVTIVDVSYVFFHYNSNDALANLSGSGTVNINDVGIEILYYGSTVLLP